MTKPLKIWSALILFLFLFPVFIQLLPGEQPETSSKKVKESSSSMVYAANITEEKRNEELGLNGKRALLYFTHTHEAFKPVTEAKQGKIVVSHQTENITKFGEKLQAQLSINGVETDILPVNNAEEMAKKRIPHYRAYKAIRPHVEQQLQKVNYDLIIDMHRDSAGPQITTATYEGEKYAKVAFVVGTENPNFAKNKAKAQQIKDEMERLVPGITRNIITKSRHDGDGKYNQELHPSVVLIELGGIGNTEEELNRTVAVIAKAVTNALSTPGTSTF
ncbi:stage II sporulation protein P [Sporosarcina sp. HYO08]|uniref:stage II sporulation protein P n=1 Tax=Sporosarcina sp. HYO08 TaxID=1759557 RepID=UPI000797A15A|nr:stage II sporulation protein P [Sporosarcina sp. HYO08]KXH87388.1 hypothetical protein AU377_02115 [Sporosarcina sp. HYO08]